MKHCPTCGSSYTDDSLVYCLQDGATLHKSGEAVNPMSMAATLREETQSNTSANESINSSSARTIKINASSLPTSPYQGARPTARSAGGAIEAPQPSSRAGVIITTVAVTLLLLAAGGLGAWMLLRGGVDGQESGRRETQTDTTNATANATANASANSAVSATPGTANAAEAGGNKTRGAGAADKGGRWFVILGSFPKEERERGVQRVDLVRRQGFDARLVSSDDYPNMKAGLWVVVMGPYTRTNAEEVLAQVRPKVKDAYTKSGW